MSEESVVENNNGEGLGMTSTTISPACDQQCSQLCQFPDCLRVLAVDDDVVFLKTLTRLLEKCCYQVTAKSNSAEALMLLKSDEDKFDMVLTDVQMQEIDGFKLLEAGLELDIPVIMMSVSDSRDVIMKGIRHGARDFLVKPLIEKEVKNIWQHVYRKTLIPCTCINAACNSKNMAADRDQYHNEELDDNADLKSGGGTSKGKRSTGGIKRKSVDDFPSSDFNPDSGIDGEISALLGQETLASGGKRERLKWTQSLHDKFVDAVESLGGVDKAVPKKILELMGDCEISREKVASHLQKFRKAMKKNQERETRNKMSFISKNNNNNNNICHAPPPPPPPPISNNNNYPLGVPMAGPSTGGCYPTPFNNNWMAHGANGYPLQVLQSVRPSYNPTMMRMMQPSVLMMPQSMDSTPPPPPPPPSLGPNFQQQQITPHQDLLMKPNNLGEGCFEPRIQADEKVMLEHPHASIVDPICQSFSVHDGYCDEDWSSLLNVISTEQDHVTYH